MTQAPNSINDSFERFIRAGFLVSLSAVVFFLPLKIHFANISVGIAAGFWVLNFRRNIRSYSPELKVPLLILTSIFWLHVAGMLYTDHLIAGLHVLERKLALLAFPVLFIVSDLGRREIDKILSVFVAGVVVSCSICYLHKFTIYGMEGVSIEAFMTDPAFQNTFFSAAIPIHPAYLSSCLILSSLILLKRVYRVSLTKKVLYILLVIFFLLTMLILMARGSLFAFVVMVILTLLIKAFRGKVTAHLAYGVIMIGCLISAGLYFIPNLKARMFESFTDYRENVFNDDEVTSVALHVKSWHCAVVSTLNQHVIFGHGTGDEAEVLKDCYSNKGWQHMVVGGYDAHNEYLSAFVRHGLVGVLVFLFLLGYCFYWSVRYDHVIYYSFLMLVAVAALSESILRGQVPLLFFAFFNACFYRLILMERINQSPLTPNSVQAANYRN
jgi:O-antigen ligase